MIFRFSHLVLLALAGMQALAAPAPAPAGFPFTDESLNYIVNWPSGLNLGEGHLRARRAGTGWSFEMTVDAAIPGFEVKDRYTSEATADFCTAEFTKDFAHGAKKSIEKETVDRGEVTRATQKGGGKSSFSVPSCVKDALALLYFTRRELGQGRVPPSQQIIFGAPYHASLQYTGAQTIQIAEKPVQSDRLLCSMKGASSDLQFEMFFARDAARTPLLIRVPLSMGRFSMELVR